MGKPLHGQGGHRSRMDGKFGLGLEGIKRSLPIDLISWPLVGARSDGFQPSTMAVALLEAAGYALDLEP